MFAKMVSMAHTPEEQKVEAKEMAVPSVPKYPWGLCLRLDEDSLKKLGLDGDLPQVGESMQFVAMAKVTSASIHESENPDGTKRQCCNVELQITDMGVPAVDAAEVQIEKSEARRKRFYGAGKVVDTDNDGE